ncbi:hypothetical protein L1887_59859 [Cichorium endivia]|nr:hypothetical protein L1887_59859 [Cichorium endivia]
MDAKQADASSGDSQDGEAQDGEAADEIEGEKTRMPERREGRGGVYLLSASHFDRRDACPRVAIDMALPCVLKFDLQHRGSAAPRHGVCVCVCVLAARAQLASFSPPGLRTLPLSLSFSRRCRPFFEFPQLSQFQNQGRDLQGQKAAFKNAKHGPQEFVPSRRSCFLRFSSISAAGP